MRITCSCLCFMFLLIAAAHAEDGNDRQCSRISQILFPETIDWQPMDSFPMPEMKSLLREKWRLRSIYLKTRKGALMEEPECSFITRALYEHFDMSSFRSDDIDGDGFADIVYSGSAECNEGDAAVIWYGATGGLADRNVTIIPFRVLTIETGGLRRISSVSIGCCAGIVDEYFIGDLKNPRRFARVRVPKILDLPRAMEIASKGYVSRNELILRTSPKRDDEYDTVASDFMARAVFGNIIAKYLPGAKGQILSTFKDAAGMEWALLLVDNASRVLRFESPYDADVGWAHIE
jgi:hypothetical protein